MFRLGPSVVGLALVACTLDTDGSGEATGDGSSSGTSTSGGVTSSTPTSSTTTLTSGSTATTNTSASAGSSGDTTDTTAAEGSTGAGPGGEYFEPEPVDELNDPAAEDDDPFLSANQLEIYFNSNRLGDEDIFVATRPGVDDPWGEPMLVSEVSTMAPEGTPRLSPNGNILFFHRYVSAAGGDEIFIVRRDAADAPWGEPEIYPDLNSTADDRAATLISGTNRVLLCSERGGSGSLDLFEGTANPGNLSASAIVLIEALSSNGEDCSALAHDNGRIVYFHSDRPGSTAQSKDLWLATRPDLSTPFELQPFEELNTADDETDPWVSADADTIYFARDGGGNADIYMTTRRP